MADNNHAKVQRFHLAGGGGEISQSNSNIYNGYKLNLILNLNKTGIQ